MPDVKPEILTWARETAGLSIEDAARAIELPAARGQTGAERLADLESGKVQPSRSQLAKMAQKYHRSLLVFYLDQVPRKGDRGQDFRTLPGVDHWSFDPTLDALIRDIKARQNLVKSVLEDDEPRSLAFVGSATMIEGVEAVAGDVARTLEFDLRAFRARRSVDDSFDYLRGKTEGAGIFLILMGNLGSHHTNISAQTFRGFAIADPVAPFVVVNDQDARAAWAFTALHEVVHLWLGTTGVSGASGDTGIERFCNDVAASILLPATDILTMAALRFSSLETAVAEVSDFAGSCNLSRAMVAYQLFRAQIITEKRWRELKERFFNDWIASKAVKDERQRGRNGGPSYYVVRRHRLGPALVSLVSRSLREGLPTHTKAGQVLGVKPRNVEPLLRGAAR